MAVLPLPSSPITNILYKYSFLCTGSWAFDVESKFWAILLLELLELLDVYLFIFWYFWQQAMWWKSFWETQYSLCTKFDLLDTILLLWCQIWNVCNIMIDNNLWCSFECCHIPDVPLLPNVPNFVHKLGKICFN